jgi:3-oxoadipate enol-lactonase
MPEIENDGARIWYTVNGPENAPAVLLLHSLGLTHELWDPQMPALRDSFRVIRYDARGHGRSTAPHGEFTIEMLGGDAIAVLDAAAVRSAAVCGISIGGLTSIWLGQHASTRVRRIVVANSAARIGSAELWSARMRDVRTEGMEAAADGAMLRWFTPEFRERHPEITARIHALACECPIETYVAACAALRDADLRRDLHRIIAPTLVIAASRDVMTTVADGLYLRDNMPSAELETLDAAHLTNVELADEFSTLLGDFLTA